MPKVPNLNELNIDQRGLATGGFSAGQATGTPAFRGSDLGNVVDQRGFAANPDFGRPMQALQISDAPDRLTQAMGQNIARFGETWQKIAIDMSDRADAARVEDAQNQLDRFTFEEKTGDNGWASRKGENAQKSLDGKTSLDEEFGERFRQVRDRIDENLGNARQRAAFAKYAEGKRYEQQQDILGHMREQFGVFEQETRKARVGAAADRIAAGDNTDIARGIETITAAVNEMAHEGGYGAEWAQQARKEAISQALSTAITTRINNGDLDGAQMLMTQYRDDLRGGHLAKATAEYQTANDIRAAVAQADADWQAGDTSFQASRDGDYYAKYNQGFNLNYAKQKLFAAESGGRANAKNPETTATGKAQFIESTWDLFGKSAIGREIRGALALGSRAWYNLRNDPRIAEIATEWYFGENRKELAKEGIPWNNMTAYLAHFAGPKGAIALYTADPGISAAEALRRKGIKGWREKVQKNPAILGGTAEHAIDVIAGKMGVKPDTSLPTGRPAEREILSETQIKRHALNYAPNNPLARQAYEGTLGLRNAEYAEAKKAAHTANVNAALDTVYRGGGIADIPASVLQDLGSEEMHKLRGQVENVANLNEATLKRENFDIYMRASRPENLTKMTEDQLLALRLDLGQDYTQSLIEKKRALEKAGKSAKEQYKMEDNMKNTVIRTAFGDLLDPYNITKDNREYLSKVNIFLQRKIDDYAPALLAKQTTEGEMMQLLINDLKSEFVLEAPEELSFFGRGWYRLGIDKKGKVKPLEDVNVLPPTPEEEEYLKHAEKTLHSWTAGWQ